MSNYFRRSISIQICYDKLAKANCLPVLFFTGGKSGKAQQQISTD